MHEKTLAPSAGKLLRRLAVPSTGRGTAHRSLSALEATALEGVTLENTDGAAPSPNDRLWAARSLLARLAAHDPDVDEAEVDGMIRDAEEALRKLDGDGEQALLSTSEAFALEAVIETDGSRPVLFVQDGTIDLNAPELRDSLAARWKSTAAFFRPGIERVVAAVGAVQVPAFRDERGVPKRIGTAFAIAPGLVITNRHVLEVVARQDGNGWIWKYDTEVDFAGEYQHATERRFRVLEAVMTGPDPINQTVNFAHLDFAVLRLADDGAEFPSVLPLEADAARSVAGAGRAKPRIYAVGFPAQPLVDPSATDGAPPGAGHEYQDVLERLYRNRFGSKRWAPGYLEAGPGQLSGDACKWVMSHDASTLGGNSGSCIVDFADTGERVVGLHFGGRPRVENYAHVLAALRPYLDGVTGLALPGLRWASPVDAGPGSRD